MKRNTFTEEIELFRRLFDGGVFCTPGKEFYCAEPGWFRVVITNYDTHFQEGKFDTRCVNVCVLSCIYEFEKNPCHFKAKTYTEQTFISSNFN